MTRITQQQRLIILAILIMLTLWWLTPTIVHTQNVPTTIMPTPTDFENSLTNDNLYLPIIANNVRELGIADPWTPSPPP